MAGMAHADAPTIVEATAQKGTNGWRFDVTISHPDTGWDHFADGWAVYAPDGTELGFRQLMHPHVTEQPFTRSLSGVVIPENITEVIIRARCSVDGWSEDGVTVSLEP